MKLPGIDLGGLNIAETVGEFLTTLKDMNAKLDTLIELQRGDLADCAECDVRGTLNCRKHGPADHLERRSR